MLTGDLMGGLFSVTFYGMDKVVGALHGSFGDERSPITGKGEYNKNPNAGSGTGRFATYGVE